MRSRGSLIVVGLSLVVLLCGCRYGFLFWEHNIWRDFHGVFTIVEPADLSAYRELLPPQFSLPDEPLVGVYVADFTDVERWPITATKWLGPYLEAAVFLRADYQDRTVRQL